MVGVLKIIIFKCFVEFEHQFRNNLLGDKISRWSLSVIIL